MRLCVTLLIGNWTILQKDACDIYLQTDIVQESMFYFKNDERNKVSTSQVRIWNIK